MIDKNLPPTKNNLRLAKDELQFSQLGHDLLDQKRNILIVEMMKLINEASSFEAKADEALGFAYKALRQTIVQSGRMHTLQLALCVNTQSDINLKTRKVMGVSVPVVETHYKTFEPHYSSVGVMGSMDEAVSSLHEALKLMGKLAELKISIMRLASETKKTIRRVNALEKMSIPNAQEVVKTIEGHLEESERDILILMKSVKRTLEAKEVEA